MVGEICRSQYVNRCSKILVDVLVGSSMIGIVSIRHSVFRLFLNQFSTKSPQNSIFRNGIIETPIKYPF